MLVQRKEYLRNTAESAIFQKRFSRNTKEKGQIVALVFVLLLGAAVEGRSNEDDLFKRGQQPSYTDKNLTEIGFPLGGIGTGSISLGGWGQLRDWEIKNRPAKGFVSPRSFFTLKIRRS